jgi:hypothetical protein
LQKQLRNEHIEYEFGGKNMSEALIRQIYDWVRRMKDDIEQIKRDVAAIKREVC